MTLPSSYHLLLPAWNPTTTPPRPTPPPHPHPHRHPHPDPHPHPHPHPHTHPQHIQRAAFVRLIPRDGLHAAPVYAACCGAASCSNARAAQGQARLGEREQAAVLKLRERHGTSLGLGRQGRAEKGYKGCAACCGAAEGVVSSPQKRLPYFMPLPQFMPFPLPAPRPAPPAAAGGSRGTMR